MQEKESEKKTRKEGRQTEGRSKNEKEAKN